MNDSIRIFGVFLWGFGCAVLGLCCEGTAHALRYASYGLMSWADRLWEEAFKIESVE